ncbi:MAG: ribosome silencing factor [Saprospiraceae bacterium]|nr:ribosome silencing factor [Saprospiraceae bacterium]
MNLHRQPTFRPTEDHNLVEIIIDAIRDIKGKRITKLDLSKIDDSPSDCFIICEGDSNTQVKALADNIQKKVLDESGLRPNHVEGTGNAKWVLVDYFSTIVHIFHPETRAFYELEDLWSDAKITYYENL